MTSQDREYFMLRAQQEDEAARCSASRIVRHRHEELSWLYQMRVQFSDREDLSAENMAMPMPGPPVS